MMAANGMRKTKLKDVCDRITVGHVGPMADKYTVEGVPFLRSQNITPFRLNLDDIKYVPPDFHAKLRKSALRPGDVAVVRTGYPGTACVIPDSFRELNCADLVVITPSKDLNPYFLAAIFNSAWGMASVAGNLVGVAQQHFNIGAARELEVQLPPRKVQDRIAGILSAYDELMENSQRRIRLLEAMARALYREWFIHFRYPGSEPSTRPAGHPSPSGRRAGDEGSQNETHPRVASPLGHIPKGWEWRELNELGFLGRGKSRHRPRNEASLYGGPYPFFQTGDIKEARIFLRTHTQTYSELGLAQSKLWQPGTLCITIAATIGETAILAKTGCIPDSVVGFVPDLEKSDAFFVKMYLDSIKQQMFDPFLGSGTTAAVATKLGRRFLGIEIDERFACLAAKRVELAKDDPSIQGYASGVFWERNTLSLQPKEPATAAVEELQLVCCSSNKGS